MKQFALFPSETLSGPVSHAPIALESLARLPYIRQMQKATAHGDVLLAPDGYQSAPVHRLVVLLPPGEFDETHLADRLWKLAKACAGRVLYLALAGEAGQEPTRRRSLATLVSLTNGLGVHAEQALSGEPSWPVALAAHLRPGDLLVCVAAHQVSTGFARRRPLGALLADALSLPVLALGGVEVVARPELRASALGMLAGLASLALIAAFFILQVQIDQRFKPLAAFVLIFLSLLAEGIALLKVSQWADPLRK